MWMVVSLSIFKDNYDEESPMTKRALITGASKGIGESMAIELAQRGWNLILVARSRTLLEALKERLEENHGVSIEVFPCDLTVSEERKQLVSFVHSKKTLDALINNAGFGSTGAFSTLSIERELNQIDLNISTVVALTHALIPLLIPQKGYVLNIASTAGFQPGPYMAVYYATKSFVLHFSEALAVELKEVGVSVTAHCPGATESEFAKVAGNDKTVLFSKLNHVMPREVVAKHAIDSMLVRKVVAIAGWRNWLLTLTVRFNPRWLVRRLAGWINQPGQWT